MNYARMFRKRDVHGRGSLDRNELRHQIVRLSAEINQCVRPAWRYYLLFWPPRRSARVLGVLARGVLGLLTRTFDFRSGARCPTRNCYPRECMYPAGKMMPYIRYSTSPP